jgi:hypothetical protein
MAPARPLELRSSLLVATSHSFMAVPAGVTRQIGHAFRDVGDRIMIAVRIRLFAELENTPVYWIAVGFLTKPLDEVLAPLGMRSLPP